jgi:hypothetical protein
MKTAGKTRKARAHLDAKHPPGIPHQNDPGPGTIGLYHSKMSQLG